MSKIGAISYLRQLLILLVPSYPYTTPQRWGLVDGQQTNRKRRIFSEGRARTNCEIREKTVPLTERMISQIGGVGCTMKPNQIPEGTSLG